MYGEKLKELRKIEGWTQEEVAKKIGVSKQTYNHYENEKRTPSLKTIRSLASVYDVDLDQVFGNEVHENKGVYETKPFVSLPIVGKISCGGGSIVFEEIEGYETTPKDWTSGGDFFYLRAKGDSMIGARIFDGDLLLIRKQPEVEDGEIAAVLIDDESVLKKVYFRDGTIILQSENQAYPPLMYTLKDKNVKIIGKLKKNVIDY